MNRRNALLYGAFVVALIVSCKKEPIQEPPTPTPPVDQPSDPPPSPTYTYLKEAYNFPIGTAVDFDPFKNNTTYRNIAKNEFDIVTFGWNMKHGALVKNDGSLDFSQADEMLSLASTNGLQVFGHTLAWHENQNATYLNNLLAPFATTGSNLVANPGFETVTGGLFTNWTILNQTNGIISAADAAHSHTGNSALKVEVTSASDAWRTQILSDVFTVTPGSSYIISYWIKGANAGTAQTEIRKSDGTVSYFGGQAVTTEWKQVTITYTVPTGVTTLAIAFDLGAAANTYYIDDVSSALRGTINPSDPNVVAAVDAALKDFITKTLTHYKGKVNAWDALNEPVVETGHLRTSANSSAAPNATDRFYWADYLGRDVGVKAFKYAAEADPTVKLFINDYNLETTPRKLDSLIAYVNELKAKGVKVDGIGTQMHVLYNGNKANIDAMFQKLAATGLLIRISELDVRMNPSGNTPFTLTSTLENTQAEVYDYIIRSYIKHIPAAQRHGITIWGISDDLSWLYKNGADYPLLFKPNFTKKKAYEAVMKATN